MIDRRGALRRIEGAGALQGVAKLQQVALRIRVTFQQVQQRVAEGRTQLRRYIVAAALAADQQALGHQLLDRLAQRRPRHAELLGQRPLRRQAFASLQRALEDHRLELRDDVVRQTALPHLTECHTTFHPLPLLPGARLACYSRPPSSRLTSHVYSGKRAQSKSMSDQSRKRTN